MSFDDDNRPGQSPGQSPGQGAYTPPTDDDLPFRRNSYDPRAGGGGGRNVGSGGGKSPPVTLIVSAVILLVLIIAVIFFYRSGMRASTDAPPAVGQPVGEMKTAAPIDAQPVDPAAGVRVYRDEAETTDAPVTFTPPPEAPSRVRPRRPSSPPPARACRLHLPPRPVRRRRPPRRRPRRLPLRPRPPPPPPAVRPRSRSAPSPRPRSPTGNTPPSPDASANMRRAPRSA
ncbi:SPOR domain-containing protein [Brevundimonas sp. SL130]|uniref:SPOR domain-containing protein n=1 Tax=Brevundimonas sp. SL130 TaxID=2995143 RepID=UPI00226D0276|nr:SPOR domain-containing protein [Brevundimonas sp. SL130]WAC60962.1 SPOR domain-containing protein [Brevundimonas sp. SL130]